MEMSIEEFQDGFNFYNSSFALIRAAKLNPLFGLL